MNWKRLLIVLVLSSMLILASATAAAAKDPPGEPTATLLVTGLEELQGSTIGPGGDLFVTAPLAGSIWRIDPQTGDVSLFATGLPPRIPGLFFQGSGVVDVAFLKGTAYALVTGVGPDLDPSQDDIVGIYRIDGPDSFTVVADIGAFSEANPPRRTSSSPPASSTRSNPSAAGSSSQTGIITGCYMSPARARSPR